MSFILEDCVKGEEETLKIIIQIRNVGLLLSKETHRK